MSTLNVLDATGHTNIIWDPNEPEEAANAKATFERLKRKGYIAYKVLGDGGRGEIMREWDPQAAKMILAPALQGG